MWGLSFCCRERGLLFIALLLVAVASLVEHKLQGVWASVVEAPRLEHRLSSWLWHMGLVSPRYVGSSPTRD